MDFSYYKNFLLRDDYRLLNKIVMYIFTIIAVIALIIVRGSLFYFESIDYDFHIKHWIATFRGTTFIEGFRTPVGDYNVPYLYILNVIARINIPDLYLVKAVSVMFDFLLAYFMMKIVTLKTKSINMHILTFILALAIPTVVLNSSMWGQCDSIYTAFTLGGIYFALSKRSKTAYAFMALAFSFKLQAAFLLPLFVIFIAAKKIRLIDYCVFILIYFAMLLPAILAGYPLVDLLNIYMNQTDSYLNLSNGAINVWAFVGAVEFKPFRAAGLFIGGTAVLGLMYYASINRKHLTDTNYIQLAYLFAVITPYLLPQMHDRFFYMADALSLLVFFFDKRRWYVPLVTVFCSYLTYVRFIMGGVFIFEFKYAAISLMLVILIVLRDLIVSMNECSKTL
ncbi:MAG: hypothetical protein LBC73_10145 [Oscillospiraceae bacterium]|nr:hypothetical protein [Oscillospiraceae bacterium]